VERQFKIAATARDTVERSAILFNYLHGIPSLSSYMFRRLQVGM
jgi:hypothetical protein